MSRAPSKKVATKKAAKRPAGRDNTIERISRDEIEMQSKPRASRGLPHQRRVAIAKFAASHPHWRVHEVAEHFGCTYSQARRAINEGANGELKPAKKPGRPHKAIKRVAMDSSPEELMTMSFHQCIAELSVNKQMILSERVTLLEKMTFMKRELQRIELQSHMKKIDARIISAIIRRYDPDVSEDDIIKIYKEVVEDVKIEAIK